MESQLAARRSANTNYARSLLNNHLQQRVQDTVASLGDEFKNVKVVSMSGIIYLQGSVADQASARKAEAIVKTVDGVLFVINELDSHSHATLS